MPFDFDGFPLWLNLAVFAAAAGVVWLAGFRISRYADLISEQTGIGHATVGLVLLGTLTALPEAAVTVSSALAGNAELAVNNILGSLAINVAILALADAAIGKDALTSVIPDPSVLLQGTLSLLLLALVAAAVVAGDILLLGIGAWSWGIAVLYAASIWIVANTQGRYPWRASGEDWQRHGYGDPRDSDPGGPKTKERDAPGPSLWRTLAKTAVAGTAILGAGFLVSRSGEAIAVQTGLGSSFMGAVFVAVSTSLPEVSTVLSAVLIRRYLLAVADIFGANLFNLGLVFVIDATYDGGPALNQVGRFSVFAALLGIVVTALFLAGLIERRDKTILRMGYDSVAVLAAYAGGLFVLYRLR